MTANDDDPGILGNLPRSRPGTRSEKRAAEERSEAAAKPAPAREPAKPAAAKARARRATAAGASKRRAGGAAAPRTAPPEPGRGGDLIGGAIAAGVQVAEAGVRVTAEIAKAVLKRLPRP